uniref:Uncharacterized protein n=1 Tax=Anguilla anguilla TaxID=7936 RepID=A0A0E9ST28_ANGAN
MQIQDIMLPSCVNHKLFRSWF